MPTVLVSDLTHHEMVGNYATQLTDKINKRRKIYDLMVDVDNDSMTATPFKITELEDYKKGTELLEASLKLFKRVFEVE